MSKHCSDCGTLLIEKELKNEGLVPFCPTCNKFVFPLYNVAVSMITVDKNTGKILLINQYSKPYYILVAGYVNRGESMETAVIREIKEETNLDVVEAHFNRTSFFERSNTLMCNFTAFVDDISNLKLNDEVDSCAWFAPDEVEANMNPETLAAKFVSAYLADKKSLL